MQKEKKVSQLYDLEALNEQLRGKYYNLTRELFSFRTKSKVLEEELQSFQQFISTVMNKPSTRLPKFGSGFIMFSILILVDNKHLFFIDIQ
jgi:hypothetical protein